MGITEDKDKSNAKNHTKKIPHLKTVNGKVIIDEKDPRQVKWFREFKK